MKKAVIMSHADTMDDIECVKINQFSLPIFCNPSISFVYLCM